MPTIGDAKGLTANAQDQRDADDGTDPERVEPNCRRRIKVVDHRDEIPDEIAPEHNLGGAQGGKVFEWHLEVMLQGVQNGRELMG